VEHLNEKKQNKLKDNIESEKRHICSKNLDQRRDVRMIKTNCIPACMNVNQYGEKTQMLIDTETFISLIESALFDRIST
jgi:hypothetical protein